MTINNPATTKLGQTILEIDDNVLLGFGAV
jgi:hypothetical protein